MRLSSLLVISSLSVLQSQAADNTEPNSLRSLLNGHGIEPFLYLDNFLPDSVGFSNHSYKQASDKSSNISPKSLRHTAPASNLTNNLLDFEEQIEGYKTHIDILEDGMNVNFTYRY